MLYTTPDFFEFEPLLIANVMDTGTVKQDVARFIGKYEKQCLLEILGACLYKEIQDSYEWDGTAKAYKFKDDATQAIKDLVGGKEYDAPEDSCDSVNWWPFMYSSGCGCGCGGNECEKRYWKGFVQTDEYIFADTQKQTKSSFIADYIYYWWMVQKRTLTTGTGENAPKSANSERMQNFSKRVDRYNEFVFLVLGGRKGETSLYRFLNDNKSDYPTWVPNCNLEQISKY